MRSWRAAPFVLPAFTISARARAPGAGMLARAGPLEEWRALVRARAPAIRARAPGAGAGVLEELVAGTGARSCAVVRCRARAPADIYARARARSSCARAGPCTRARAPAMARGIAAGVLVHACSCASSLARARAPGAPARARAPAISGAGVRSCSLVIRRARAPARDPVKSESCYLTFGSCGAGARSRDAGRPVRPEHPFAPLPNTGSHEHPFGMFPPFHI